MDLLWNLFQSTSNALWAYVASSICSIWTWPSRWNILLLLCGPSLSVILVPVWVQSFLWVLSISHICHSCLVIIIAACNWLWNCVRGSCRPSDWTCIQWITNVGRFVRYTVISACMARRLSRLIVVRYCGRACVLIVIVTKWWNLSSLSFKV